MDLFYSSGFLAHTAVSSSLLDQLGDHTGKTDNQHNDFIRFLQIASALEAPILPLTWDPAFEALGRDGATGRINQAPLNAGITFAFKRFNPQGPWPAVSQDDFRRIQYNAMIAEMTILMRKDIRRHQNIITFVGTSFELSKDSDKVRPVLVFTKADLGDLHTFLSNYGPLDVSMLVAICGEVAKGIDVMHRCGNYGLPHPSISKGKPLQKSSDLFATRSYSQRYQACERPRRDERRSGGCKNQSCRLWLFQL
ncbi:hypothetical protein B0O99DRAFT_235208 [Bisporella sp. PMI_857]|nr:hypothetical protein B0O99DRAFT_235208 [Bisporella sp. PMI_857]